MSTATATRNRGSSSTTTDALRSRSWMTQQVDAFINASPRYFSPMQRRAFLRSVCGKWRETLDLMDNPLFPQDKTFFEDPTGETAIQNIMKELATH